MDLVNQVYAIEGESRNKAKSDSTEAKLSIAMLATRLGEQPESLGTDTVYKVLEELVCNVSSLQAVLRNATDPKIEAGHQ
jgi:hypothetical protein